MKLIHMLCTVLITPLLMLSLSVHAKHTSTLAIDSLNQALFVAQKNHKSDVLLSHLIKVLKLKDHQQHLTIEQNFHGIESRNHVDFVITQAGLLDDAVSGIKHELTLKKANEEPFVWKVISAKQSFLCRRSNTSTYQDTLCP